MSPLLREGLDLTAKLPSRRPCEAMLPAKQSTGERDRLLRGGAAEAVRSFQTQLGSSVSVPSA